MAGIAVAMTGAVQAAAASVEIILSFVRGTSGEEASLTLRKRDELWLMVYEVPHHRFWLGEPAIVLVEEA